MVRDSPYSGVPPFIGCSDASQHSYGTWQGSRSRRVSGASRVITVTMDSLGENCRLPKFTLRVLIFLVLLAFVDAQEPLATKMQVIREDLDRQFNEIMALEPVSYSTINTTAVLYNASTKFYPKGMGQLYNVTNMFMDLIQSKQAYPEGMITIENGALEFADPIKEWKIIGNHYAGVLGLAIAGLLLAAILPCVGLFFCCCRCAGNCGARSQPFDKKHDHCRKIMLSIVLICVATILLFGVVCAFVTNEYMQEGTEEMPSNIKTNLKDVQLYLQVTKQEINNLFGENYDALETRSNEILQASGRIVSNQLARSSHAVSLTNLNNIVAGLDKIQQNLETIDIKTKQLRTKASNLSDGMRNVKLQLLNTLKNCTTPLCKQVQNEYVNNMSMTAHFDKLPDVSSTLLKIKQLMNDGIVSEVSQGNKTFTRIQKNIQDAVNKTIPMVSRSIRNAGDFLQTAASNITSILDTLSSDIENNYIPKVEIADKHINQYAPYRYYLGLGISVILLTVLLCLTFGLLCGVCGKRPDGYGDDCCNKGAGARFLMMAVWIIFLLTSILMIITVAHMVTGVVVQRGICEPLKNPRDNRMFELVDDFIQIQKRLYPNNPEAELNMSYIVTACHANETIYNVLKLENLIDFDSLRDYAQQYNINSTMQKLREKISLSQGVVILSDKAKLKLNELAQSGLSDIKFDRYAEQLSYDITTINLDHLATELRTVAAQLPSGEVDMYNSLMNSADDLDEKHQRFSVPIAQLSTDLIESAKSLQEHIKFNHSSMPEAINVFVTEVTDAQQFLTERGSHYVEQLATKFETAFLRQFDDFMDYVTASGLTSIGRCAPVSNAYNATLVATCNKILDPFNGFWASVGWCLILYIPTIILCVKLSALYQKSDPYPGPLVEAEYLYDAYADRDNIPLAHVHDKKHAGHSRHHPAVLVESYDGPADAYGDHERISDAHQSSSHHDSRYSDLAPKNCDFPNGGPPRYQPATAVPPLSTEYERPPPYYYPGPGDRN